MARMKLRRRMHESGDVGIKDALQRVDHFNLALKDPGVYIKHLNIGWKAIKEMGELFADNRTMKALVDNLVEKALKYEKDMHELMRSKDMFDAAKIGLEVEYARRKKFYSPHRVVGGKSR